MGGSSTSRRRKAYRHRTSPFRPRPSPPIPTTTHRLTFNSLTITQGIGYDLLLKSGWQPGSPIGQSPVDTSTLPCTPHSHTGTPSQTTPLSILVKRGRAGLGAPQTVVEEDHAQHVVASASAPQLSDAYSCGHHVQRVTHVASAEVFDPLRPRCKYNSSHVVRNLKMLRKHEISCPANPARGGEGGVEAQERVVNVGNLFEQLELDSSSGGSSSSTSSDSGDTEDDGILSDFSDDDNESCVAGSGNDVSDEGRDAVMSDGEEQVVVMIGQRGEDESGGQFGKLP